MNSYYPGYQNMYQPMYYGGYQMPTQPMGQQSTYPQDGNAQQTTYQQPPIQNGGFVPVQSEEEARKFPVQPGRCVTFRNINEPYCYTKTQSYNTFEPFEFKKYRVEEEVPAVETIPVPASYMTREDADSMTADIREQIRYMENEIAEMRELVGTIVAKKPAGRIRKDEEE